MFRAASYSVPALLLVFVGLYAAAAAAYPGGTWEEPARHGHSFLFNYYCDLLRPTALNGEANPLGSQLAELGQLVFALALGPFFIVAPALFEKRRVLARSVRALGIVALIAGIGVVLTPSWRYGQTVHGIFLLVCAGPAIAALVGVMVGTWSVPPLRALALALVVSMLLTIGIFVRQLAIGTETTFGLAPLQRIDFALALGWMTLTALRGERARRAAGTAP